MTIEITQNKKRKSEFVIWVTINYKSQLFVVTGKKQLKKIIHQFI